MIKSIFNFLSGIANALGSIFGFFKQRDSELNSPEMIKNKEQQQEQDSKDKVNTDLKNNNTTELGKDISI